MKINPYEKPNHEIKTLSVKQTLSDNYNIQNIKKTS
jgi:hypothetical protein